MQDCRAILPLKPAPFASSRGFTLIEMSIVLVIVGLIIGGILMGNTMIKSAEYRAQVSDIEKLKAAINTFKLKYNCLPGDCAYATQLFGGASQPQAVTNGNGDGKIAMSNAGTYPSTAGNPTPGDTNFGWAPANPSGGANHTEWTDVFDHLAAAGMWPIAQYNEYPNMATAVYPDVICPGLRFKTYGSPSDIAAVVVPGCMNVGYVPGYNISGYSNIVDGHKIALGAYGGTGQLLGSAGLNPWEAFTIDAKIDDGMPFTGRAVILYPSYIYRGNDFCSGSGRVYLNENNVSIGAGGIPRLRFCPLYISADF